MTKQEILHLAKQQSAYDLGCAPEDFDKGEPVVVRSVPDARARRYLQLPFVCNLVSYGRNVVASVSEPYESTVRDYIARFTYYHLFETPNLHVLNDALQERGASVCFMAEYFLPASDKLPLLPCSFPTRLLTPPEFDSLYTDAWSNALCAERKQLDKLCVGAYDGDTLIGLAGCSADCDEMYQIGVDVLPAYRGRGIAPALTSRLAAEIFALGKLPFYCAAWSNLISVRNALKCGFFPAWVELTAKSADDVDRMNR